MQKTQPAAPPTVTWIPTRADTIETDVDGNVIAVNGVPVKTPPPEERFADAGDS